MTAYAVLVVLALMGVWGVAKRIVALADRAEGRESATPPLLDDELERYRAALAGTARPTVTQIEAFAEYVATAHSWYKHLPWWPPGIQFVFFLDPAAGMDLSLGDGGTIVSVARQERGFHYSAIPTAEYRVRFGCLTFSDRRGTKVYLARDFVKQRMLEDDADSFFEQSTGTRVHLPKVVSVAGAAGLSGLIHYVGRTDYTVGRALTSVLNKRKKGAEFRFSNADVTLDQVRTLAEEGGHFYWPVEKWWEITTYRYH